MLVRVIAVVVLDEFFVDKGSFGQIGGVRNEVPDRELFVWQAVFEAVSFARGEGPFVASRHVGDIDEFEAWGGFEVFLDGLEVVEDIGFKDEEAAGFEVVVSGFKEAVVEESSSCVSPFPPGIGKKDVYGIDGMRLEQDGQREFGIGMNDVAIGKAFPFQFSDGCAAQCEFELNAEE